MWNKATVLSSWHIPAKYTHLAEYRDGAGQFTDYVLNGNFSLKTNETGRIGEILRSEEEVKLKGNTAYVMEFTYETGIADAYRISVKSQSKGMPSVRC